MSEPEGRGAAPGQTQERGTSDETSLDLPRRQAGGRASAAAISWIREAALLPVLAVLLVVGAILNSHFLTVSNITGIGQQASSLGVVVVGESLILLIGGLDLSLEATYGLAPMLAAWLIVPVASFGSGTELNPFLGILLVFAVGAVIGLVNGLLIVKGRLNGFIVTLGMTILLAASRTASSRASPRSTGRRRSAGSVLPTSAWFRCPSSSRRLIFVITGLFLRYHRFGRAIYAVGGNLAAARAAGIRVDRVRIWVYVAGSMLGALGGLMEAGRVSSVASTQGYGEGIIFTVFAAAVIGGVSPARRPGEHGGRRVRGHPAQPRAEPA